jgi:uncharacterized protein YqjF (DUF2071 family)
MQQRWHQISFFHWPCEPALLQDRLPASLSIDSFDGAAWISLTPFLLQGLRPPLFPRGFGLDFPETNLRTYVQGPRGPGIWFFSLDAARLSAVVGARSLYGLPYYRSNMEVRIMNREISYSSNRDGLARVAIRVEKGPPIIDPSPLDLFLTARFRLYSVRRSTLLTAKVAHPHWPLNSAKIAQFEEGLRRAAKLPFEASPALCHHSDGVDTRIGPPIPVS